MKTFLKLTALLIVGFPLFLFLGLVGVFITFIIGCAIFGPDDEHIGRFN